MSQAVTMYEDRDNSFDIVLSKNNVLLTESEMSLITKFEIKFNGSYYNSVDNPTGFVLNAAESSYTVKIVNLSLTASTDKVTEVIVYTSVYTNGMRWDSFDLTINGDVTVV